MQKSQSVLLTRKKKKKKLMFPIFPSAFHQITPVHLKDFQTF